MEYDYKFFWKTFRHYSNWKGWAFNDYSCYDSKDFSINLNLDINNTDTNN